MKKKNPLTIKNILSAALILSAVLFVSCKKEKAPVITGDTIQLEVQPAEKTEKEDVFQPQQWHITNRRIIVMLGYDFNSAEDIQFYTQLLQNRYGLDQDGGLIYLLTYPDSFKHLPKAYVSELTSYLTETDKDIEGVIILGAPENTHAALARLQDYWEMAVPYPVFALFPQDDVLGLESTCDFVLDNAQKAEVTGDNLSEEEENLTNSKAPEILENCIDYIQAVDSALAKDLSLQKHAEQMLKDKKLQHYVDPETGIPSINHFVLLSE